MKLQEIAKTIDGNVITSVNNGKENGVFVLTGAEVTSREEVHCLSFFEDDKQLASFQRYLDDHLIPFPNDPLRFGHQVVVP